MDFSVFRIFQSSTAEFAKLFYTVSCGTRRATFTQNLNIIAIMVLQIFIKMWFTGPKNTLLGPISCRK